MKSNSAKDVLLTYDGGRVSSGDERPGPAVETFPRANRMVGRDRRRRLSQHGSRGWRGSGHVDICVARDHLTVLAQIGAAHHATGSTHAPTAGATAFTFSQTVLVSGQYQLVSRD